MKSAGERLAEAVELALDKLEDSARAEVAAGTNAYRFYAVGKITNPKILASIATNRNYDGSVRGIALLSCADKALPMALNNPDLTVRRIALLLLSDQSVLRRFAVEEPMASIREVAVRGIDDDAFLLGRFREESSPTVRAAIVGSLHNAVALSAAALSYYHDVRDGAKKRLESGGSRAGLNRKLSQPRSKLFNGSAGQRLRSRNLTVAIIFLTW